MQKLFSEGYEQREGEKGKKKRVAKQSGGCGEEVSIRPSSTSASTAANCSTKQSPSAFTLVSTDYKDLLFYCEAQARVRQGSARDGPQGKRPQSLNPCLGLTLKLVATFLPVTSGHLRNYRLFFFISKHKANTTELHPKVRQTCFSKFR